jgi:hypothetical protein
MFIICDSSNVVQDIASDKANLSRGLSSADYKLYENVKISDVRIGDTFDGIVLTPNQTERTKRQQRQQYEQLIIVKNRELAIAALKAEGKLPADYVDPENTIEI